MNPTATITTKRPHRPRRILRLAAAVACAATGALLIGATSALAVGPPRIYWANQGSSNTIGEANLDGTDVNQSLIAGVTGPVGVAVDDQHVYWASYVSGTIGEANLDGTDVNQSFIAAASSPFGVAVDGRHVYWTNPSSGTIGEANLDGTGVDQSLISGADDPFGVAVDGRHIYWTNWANGTIGEANLDGTAVNQSLITGADLPYGVAVDGQHVYWTNDGSGTIGRADLDGSDADQSFIGGAKAPHGVAVDGQHVYWTNDGTGTIGEANLDGTGVNQSLITGADEPIGVAVSVPIASVTPAAPTAFAPTSQGTLSAPRTLTISNSGQRDLSIAGVSFTGADPSDFAITSNGCIGSVAPGESCTLTVGFAPQAQGARSATLQIATNDYANSPLQVPLSGTGAGPNQGPRGPAGPQGPTGPQGATGARGATGSQGATGPRGATGPAGPAGRAGKVELITCKTAVKKIHGHRRTVKKCTGRLVSGTIKFTSATTERATVSRGQVVYATGAIVALGNGRSQLLLQTRRALRRGRYTLTERELSHGHRSVRRATITIGQLRATGRTAHHTREHQ
jgi:virginiamycin B lyase